MDAGPDLERAQAQYRQLAEVYDWRTRRIARVRRAAIDRLLLQERQTVLDVACGTGASFPLLSKRVGRAGRVIGIDASAEMLEVARRRIAESGLGNVELVEAPVETASIEGLADAALFSFTHDVLQLQAAVDNVVTHLRKGARIVSVGTKAPSRWNVLVNLLVRRIARPFVTTYQGFDRPYRLLEPAAPNMRIESVLLGAVYIAWGEVEEVPGSREDIRAARA